MRTAVVTFTRLEKIWPEQVECLRRSRRLTVLLLKKADSGGNNSSTLSDCLQQSTVVSSFSPWVAPSYQRSRYGSRVLLWIVRELRRKGICDIAMTPTPKLRSRQT
ncbi:hypothetical protein R1flu_002831 [Riccia fluitans]|uniref:N-acetyltransferase domain-containing protein n=1 Tax=Riccia fluitans TaxID=41844 RepID=A0ABD1Y790_9MARC